MVTEQRSTSTPKPRPHREAKAPPSDLQAICLQRLLEAEAEVFNVGPEVSDAEHAAWVRAFNTAMVLPGFAEDRARTGLQPPALTGAALDAYIERQMAQYRALAVSGAWLVELKSRIHAAQQRATLAVNRELVAPVLADWPRHPGAAGRTGPGTKVIDRAPAAVELLPERGGRAGQAPAGRADHRPAGRQR